MFIKSTTLLNQLIINILSQFSTEWSVTNVMHENSTRECCQIKHLIPILNAKISSHQPKRIWKKWSKYKGNRDYDQHAVSNDMH